MKKTTISLRIDASLKKKLRRIGCENISEAIRKIIVEYFDKKESGDK